MTHITLSVAPVAGQFLECPCVYCCMCVVWCVCVHVHMHVHVCVCISYLSLPEVSWIAEQLDCTIEDAVLNFHDRHIP